MVAASLEEAGSQAVWSEEEVAELSPAHHSTQELRSTAAQDEEGVQVAEWEVVAAA